MQLPRSFALVLLAACLALAAHRAEAAEPRSRVIVRLAAPAPEGRETAAAQSERRRALERSADAALARLGGPPRDDVRRYRALPLLALEVTERERAELAAAPEVLAIEPDRLLAPSLLESIPRVGAKVASDAGYAGAGAAVVIVDTGVDAAHAFLGGRVVAEACFSAGRDCPNGRSTQVGSGAGVPCTYGSLCYHGTHVAGIAAGLDATRQGVAPAASIIAIQTGSEITGTACGSAGSPCVQIYDSDALAALDYVADTLAASWNVAAVNMSFGSDTTWSSESACDAANASYKTAIDVLRALDIAAVVAAGNGSVTTGISAPACISTAIGVSASTDTGESAWVKSNSGPPTDLYAPGTNITSSIPGGSFSTVSGTSMAAPHVSGAFAVLRAADPAASVAAAESALESSGYAFTDSRNGLVRPRLQLDDAVRALAPAACFDGLDNDGDGKVDVDGDGGAPDPECSSGADDAEQPPAGGGGCGVGPELALALPLLGAFRHARRRRGRARG